jgi:hypothetical protein
MTSDIWQIATTIFSLKGKINRHQMHQHDDAIFDVPTMTEEPDLHLCFAVI